MQGGTQTGMGEAAVEHVRDWKAAWWAAAVLLFGVGDVVTTVVGVETGRAAEASPVVAWLLEQYGPAVMVPLKLFTFGVFYLGWRLFPSPYRLGFPLGLTVVGALATGWNLVVLSGTL